MNSIQSNSTANVRLCQLPVGKLLAVQPYQEKRYYPNNIKKIVDKYDPYLLGAIKVSERDGVYYIIDGKHRCIATKIKFGDDKLVNCEVYSGLTYQDEARVFADQYANTKTVTPYQRLNGMIEARDPDALNIYCSLKRNGLAVADSGTDGVIRCVTKIIGAYKTLGKDGFDEFISLLVSTWRGSRDSLDAQILGGTAMFYRYYRKTFDRKRFVSKLRTVEPTSIVRSGISDASAIGDLRYAKAIWREYNYGLSEKNRIPYLFKG